MSSIEERLDKVRELIQNDDFLCGRGLSNEVNIRIFCYEPEDEMAVRHFVEQVKTDQNLRCHLVERNLFHVFLDACDDLGITESVPEVEEEDGSADLREQLRAARYGRRRKRSGTGPWPEPGAMRSVFSLFFPPTIIFGFY